MGSFVFSANQKPFVICTRVTEELHSFLSQSEFSNFFVYIINIIGFPLHVFTTSVFLIVKIKFLDFEQFYFPSSCFYQWMYSVKIRKSIEICKKKVSPLISLFQRFRLRLTRVGQKRIPILHSFPHSLYFLPPPLYKSVEQATNRLRLLLLNLCINSNNEYRT